jgi:GntR family transcriptional repressor for pyruvate dehydrogenase complex
VTGPSTSPTPRAPLLRWQRLAEVVAGHIRDRILRGDLEDGALLPKEAELREQYPVNPQSLREAMRILEAEGLVTVRRGNRGGAVVHQPTPGHVAYSLSLVLTMSGTDMGDVGRALREVEPICAGLCAERPDRDTAVVPVLRALHADALACVDDLVATTSASRRFHEALVGLCGNQSLIAMAGALEALWSSHETVWALQEPAAASVPVAERQAALAVHGQLLELLAAGDAAAVTDLAARHLQDVQAYPGGADHGLDPTPSGNGY